MDKKFIIALTVLLIGGSVIVAWAFLGGAEIKTFIDRASIIDITDKNGEEITDEEDEIETIDEEDEIE